MPEFCTCGTRLVDNARFCHRCGKPVFEEPAIEPEPERVQIPQVPNTRVPPVQLPVGFRNPIALRVAFLMSVAIMLAEMIPGVQLLLPLWWLAAGWGAVALYRRLTGFAINVRAGARLGSLTGVLTFVSMAVIISVSMAFTGKQVFQQMLTQNPQFASAMNDPAQLALGVLLMLVIVFAMVVGVCAAGGALGARFAGRNGSPAR